MKPRISCALLCLSIVLAGAAAGSGCATRRAAATAPGGFRDTVERLRSDLGRIFADPNFANAQWGVEIVSLDRGEPIFSLNEARLYMPASNNKLLTSAAALVRLGPAFRFETRLAADGEVHDGVLHGNLWVVGSGDPTLCARFHDGDSFAPLRAWAARLKGQGIRKVAGDLVGDGRTFEPQLLGLGWEWDDLPFGYAAPVSALQFNENVVTVEIAPGPSEGSQASCKGLPAPDYLAVDLQVHTGAPSSETRLELERAETGERVAIRGTIAQGAAPATRTLAVRYPTLYLLHAFRSALAAEGIDVSGCGVRACAPDSAAPDSLRVLHTHPSPHLSEILKPLLKVSQNLYAETLARTLGRAARGDGSFERGREVVEEVLRGMAIEKGTYRYADGSGLSRLNLVSADLIVRILRYMYRSRHFDAFFEALPVAGADGTIASRMKGTRAEKNVRAKTGTIANVRALSGYVRTADGEMLAFSMLANNFLVSTRAAEYVQDLALERLANFTRR